MSNYKQKAKESFNTKKNIFLFSLSVKGTLNTISEANIKLEFIRFDLKENCEIIRDYESSYWQKDYDDIVVQEKTVNQIYNEIKKWESINSRLVEELKIDYVKSFPTIFSEDVFERLKNGSKCHYCKVSKNEIELLRKHRLIRNKHETRGYSFEIDRKWPNLEYSNENCVTSCFWCNNAKTDEYDENEFLVVAKGIRRIWELRLSTIE
ncbi:MULTISPECIES: hypothetical protein [unclassified Aureispira]|uniref:hypothetical protein n=1 Tax=unclassified Aureispira TaxID=2649989 RepID=UPI000695E64C|nr:MULTISPECIES: hypothetical protein [unclassified Aureispira]WMX15476.1 hypothetical protein QP953_03685 [Aureispira sp. CCB-E]